MRRLSAELLTRTKTFSHRMVDVAEAIDAKARSKWMIGRVLDQIVGCGTSVGANTREADEAVSRADFCKSLGIVMKELGECRFWLEFVGERGWVPASRLDRLCDESVQLSKVFHVMVARIRRDGKAAKPVRSGA